MVVGPRVARNVRAWGRPSLIGPGAARTVIGIGGTAMGPAAKGAWGGAESLAYMYGSRYIYIKRER